MALTELAICNMALARCGIGSPLVSGDGATGTIAATTSTGLEADLCKTYFPIVQRELLETYPFSFALKYADLAGTTTCSSEVWGGEWLYKYTYPSDAARLWRWARTDTPAVGSVEYARWLMQDLSQEDPEYQYAVRSVDGTKVILGHLESTRARMIYCQTAPSISDYPYLVGSAMAWRIASEVATPLLSDPTRAEQARAMFYNVALPQAIAIGANEQGQQAQQDGAYVRSRWGW
ncbi:MAG: hypothetical protein KDA28_07080 [Phycisphaerales bacterium]|nr:hypothetical protein [Phycisphaerales bacterium]